MRSPWQNNSTRVESRNLSIHRRNGWFRGMGWNYCRYYRVKKEGVTEASIGSNRRSVKLQATELGKVAGRFCFEKHLDNLYCATIIITFPGTCFTRTRQFLARHRSIFFEPVQCTGSWRKLKQLNVDSRRNCWMKNGGSNYNLSGEGERAVVRFFEHNM